MDKTQIAVEIFDDWAEQYEEKFMEFDLYHDTFDLFCKEISTPSAYILELACGPGNITKYLLQQRPNFKIRGTDLSPNMITLAKKNNPTAEFELMDCRDIGKLDQSFHGIICGFALPYLSKEESISLIRDAYQILHPAGIFYVSTMEGDYKNSGFQGNSSGKGKQLYIHYHQEDYLAQALTSIGFEILHISRKKYPQKEGSYTTDLILLAKKQIR